MVTNDYHANQDIPNLEDADTALALFQQQQAMLTTVKEEADADLHQIEASLGKTLKFAQEKGLTKLEERVNHQWKLAQLQHRRVTHLNAALGGAGTAIKALAQQRDAVTAEHARLVDAINRSDEDHPQLASYAAGIRENEQESIYFGGDWGGDDIDFEFVYERNCELIVENWDVSEAIARRLMDVINGDESMTDVQRDAFITFLRTLDGQAQA